jgi:hypothetical protein
MDMEQHWKAVCGDFDALRNVDSLTETCQTIRNILQRIVAAYDQAELGTLTERNLAKLVLTAHSRPPLLSDSTAALTVELLRLEAVGSPWNAAVKASVNDAARHLAMDIQYFAYTITSDYFLDLPAVAESAGFVIDNHSSVQGAASSSRHAGDQANPLDPN